MSSFYANSPARDQIDADTLTATQAKDAAEAAKVAAQLAQQGAEASESGASTYAANAAASAASASNSAASASSASSSAVNSASAAASSASSASSSAASAAASETSAAASEAAAAISASSASNSATNAATSASNAAADALTASNQASAATSSAANAASSATAAMGSESSANASAQAASLSELAASSSATSASNSATSAASSASNAATSEANAAASEAASAVSASNAATSESNAAASAASAAASFDSFDDRYLGAKSSAPTLDNDGAALITGALYFDSATGSMKIWTGSTWEIGYSAIQVALQKNNNLSDLNNAATARTNLGLGTAAVTDAAAYATAAQGAVADSAVQPGDNVSTLVNDASYATVSQVDTAVANLVAAAPSTLDTLNELATALGNDPNFATTVSNQIGLKLDTATWTASAAYTITTSQISNWDAAYGWGNHASQGYATTSDAIAMAIALG